MSLSITSVARIIQAYGNGRFRIANESHAGSVIVFADETLVLDVTDHRRLRNEHLQAVIDRAGDTDLLIVGCGETFCMPSVPFRDALREHGIVMEWMTTGAACRTFNVLIAEGRKVAAILIAVPDNTG